jgi:hypothetical protein
MDPQLWQDLQTELTRQLDQLYPGQERIASMVPLGDSAAASLGYDMATQSLRWFYSNPGDYDQNGLVGISDLTPLGVNFGMGDVPVEQPGMFGLLAGSLTEPFGPENALAQIDGDDNGQIGIADITPIGQNFGNAVQAWRVYAGSAASDYPASNSAPSTLTALAEIPLAAALGEKSLDRLAYTYELPGGQEGQSYWVRPVLDGVEGTPSNIAGVQPAGGPLALLAVSPQSVEPGMAVRLEFNQPLEALAGSLNLALGEEFEFTLAEMAIMEEQYVFFVAPLLPPGSHEFTLKDGTDILTNFSLTVEASASAVTVPQFQQLLADSISGVKVLGTDEVIYDLFGFQDEDGIQAAPLAAELAKFDELFMVLEAWLADALQGLSPGEQNQLLVYLENTGCLGILQDMTVQGKTANRAASFTNWSNNFDRLYYDAQSARISNSGLFWDLASISIGLVSGGAGFAVSAVSMVLSLERHIIDLVYPTDIAALFVDMPRLRLRSDREYEVKVSGHFYSERKPSAGQTLEALLTSIVGALPIPAYLEQELLQVFADYVIITGANMGVELALAEVLPTIEDPDNPWDGHVDGGWSPLDPFLYASDNPKDVFAKLGQTDPEKSLEEAVEYYRNFIYFPSNRSQDGDFITGLGGGYRYRLGERSEAFVRFNASSHTSLIFRAFSFRAKAGYSYPELVSAQADFWADRDSDWTVSDVVLADGTDILGIDDYARIILTTDDYPLVMAVLDSGNGMGPHVISAKLPSGSSWLAPVALPAVPLSAGSEYYSLGIFQGNPAAVYHSFFIQAENLGGSAWPSAWEEVISNGNSISDARIYEIVGQPALCGGYGAAVYRREPISHDWNLTGIFNTQPYNIGYFAVCLVDGRPAIAFGDYSDQDEENAFTRVDNYYAIADDPSGSGWSEPVLVSSSTSADGQYLQIVDMAEIGDKPGIVFSRIITDGGIPPLGNNFGYDGLFYSAAGGPEGASWSAPVPIIAAGWELSGINVPLKLGWHADNRCLAEIAGKPALAFTQRELGDLGGRQILYSEAQDSSGQTWQEPQPVAQVGGEYKIIQGLIETAAGAGMLFGTLGDGEHANRWSPVLPEARLRYASR